MRRGIGVTLLAGLLALAVAACGSSNTKTTSNGGGGSSEAGIKTAPAFSSTELTALGGNNWITPSGGVTGDLFSEQKQISTSNVSQLKGDWMTELNGSGVAEQYSAEAAPVEYEGVLYIPTGADDIFAVSVETGKILWEHKGELPESTAGTVCCGWDNRGVAIGDGLVFSAVLNGAVEALDQKTGKLVWETKIGTPKEGFTVTANPLYYDGMIVIGPVGSEYGVRGFISAYNAKTGKLIWRHYNIPGPGEPGHNTWPQDNEEWKHGGATTWDAPSVDPKLGLLYYSTANAGDDYYGKLRPGDNLYTASILALDIKTGKMKWYYQEVHHDIWDQDGASPTTLINVEVHGKMREGIAETNKNGFVYFLDRRTGKPIFPIPETPVPQAKIDATAKTEPIPTMPPAAPVKMTKKMQEEVQASVDETVEKGQKAPEVVQGGVDGQFPAWESTSSSTIQAGGHSGQIFAPASFDPENGYYYTCTRVQMNAKNIAPEQEAWEEGKDWTGVVPISATLPKETGVFTAYDMHTGKIAWRHDWPDSCVSGTVTTAGNLVFVGRNKGQEQAYNATTGKLLWSFGTGAGANAPVAVYNWKGQERVAILSGGNALQATTRGDNLWQFSLEGTKGPVPLGSSAKVEAEEKEEEAAAAEEESGGEAAEGGTPTAAMISAGKTLFQTNCATCHGVGGEGTENGPNLNDEPRAKSNSGVIAQLNNPIGSMPSFKAQLTDKEKEEVAAFVTTEVTHTAKE